ncbi:tRNA (cytosine(38)-C(5))-methyltransferase [Drosophila busckii]|uniref:tRNA (cytosine(38)-C(5))-methyltransferase n=1 Tax=Drosophila busckii TaxID=30019 RepID=UPI001432E8D9|nr:tRNA (cytosine(38)-C(5))-methyltransferase [Drosophila busckii]
MSISCFETCKQQIELTAMEYNVLELFSGIGGMHFAFKYAQLKGEVVAAMDVNTVANAVYAHNYKTTNVKTRNIQSISEKEVRKLNANMLLMSPPCQPHTRQGLQRDTEDKRSCALTHLCELIPQCETLKYVLMENVKGFETSQARKQFIEALENANFNWREFILTPSQFNVPNTRHRYYCIARRDKDFDFEAGKIWDHMPGVSSSCALETMCTISSILEPNVPSEALVPDDVLTKRVLVMDIVHPEQSKSMCFTKGYTHYTEGTGSAFSPLSKQQAHNIFEVVRELDKDDEAVRVQRLELLRQIKLRYFTAREVARLMSFPEFEFPAETTNRQKYRLLGNSINVRVVGELLKLLTTT